MFLLWEKLEQRRACKHNSEKQKQKTGTDREGTGKRNAFSSSEAAGERRQQIGLRDQGEGQGQRDERRVQTRWREEKIKDTGTRKQR